MDRRHHFQVVSHSLKVFQWGLMFPTFDDIAVNRDVDLWSVHSAIDYLPRIQFAHDALLVNPLGNFDLFEQCGNQGKIVNPL